MQNLATVRGDRETVGPEFAFGVVRSGQILHFAPIRFAAIDLVRARAIGLEIQPLAIAAENRIGSQATHINEFPHLARPEIGGPNPTAATCVFRDIFVRCDVVTLPLLDGKRDLARRIIPRIGGALRRTC